jgi:hypothetical protein
MPILETRAGDKKPVRETRGLAVPRERPDRRKLVPAPPAVNCREAMTADSSLPFPHLREENRIWPQNSPITPSHQVLTHFEQQLGREAAGKTPPGFPNPTGCLSGRAIVVSRIRSYFGSKMATKCPRTTPATACSSEHAAIKLRGLGEASGDAQ